MRIDAPMYATYLFGSPGSWGSVVLGSFGTAVLGDKKQTNSPQLNVYWGFRDENEVRLSCTYLECRCNSKTRLNNAEVRLTGEKDSGYV